MESKRPKLNDDANASKGLNDELVLNAVFNPHSPLDLPQPASEQVTNIPTCLVPDEVKKLEIQGVNLAQNGDLITSLDLFNQVVEMAPNYPSIYNNRAQLLRLQGENEAAMMDLSKAVQLSGGKGLAASQAYVQRGLLHQLYGNCEESQKDFQAAAQLGNAFAKNQLVVMNPYAALCNQMLGEVFSRVRNGEADLV